MTRLGWLLAGLVLATMLAACGSSRRAQPYSGRLYSIAQVQRAFAGLGLELHKDARGASGLVYLVNNRRLGPQSISAAPRLVTVVVATQRTEVGSSKPLPGRTTSYANVTAFSKPSVLDEVRGAVSALRWGALAQARLGKRLIVPGKSIGNIRMGESRKKIENALGPGMRSGRGVVSYFGGHLLVDYEFHDRIYPWVTGLETRWSAFRTSSGVHVGSRRQGLSRLYATCDSKTECHLLEGPWPDALATSFTMRDGKVAEIGIGYS